MVSCFLPENSDSGALNTDPENVALFGVRAFKEMAVVP
jgi:hypothetical protein